MLIRAQMSLPVVWSIHWKSHPSICYIIFYSFMHTSRWQFGFRNFRCEKNISIFIKTSFLSWRSSLEVVRVYRSWCSAHEASPRDIKNMSSTWFLWSVGMTVGVDTKTHLFTLKFAHITLSQKPFKKVEICFHPSCACVHPKTWHSHTTIVHWRYPPSPSLRKKVRVKIVTNQLSRLVRREANVR